VGARQRHISQRRVIWSLNTVAFSWSLGLGASMPVIPLLAYELRPDVALAGLVVAMGGGGRLLVSYVTGPMIDRFGRRAVAIVGVTVRMIFSFAEGLSPTYLSLVGFRFMSGVGTAIWGTGLATITADISTRSNRGSITGGRQGFQHLGFIIGPFLGTAAWAATGDIRVPFMINGFSKLVCLLVFLFVMVETRSLSQQPEEAPAATPASLADAPAPEPAGPRFGWQAIFASGFLLIAIGLFASGLFRAAVVDVMMPLFVRNVLELPQATLGLTISAIGLGGLAASFPGGYAADRWGVGYVVAGGALMGALGLGLLTQSPGSVALVALGVLMGAGSTLLMVGTQAFAIDISPSGARGRFFGRTQAAMHLAALVGPFVVGAIANAVGFNAAFVALAAFFAFVAPVGLFMARHRGARKPAEVA
jgi:MFS family permease